jgi:hypothetical protein
MSPKRRPHHPPHRRRNRHRLPHALGLPLRQHCGISVNEIGELEHHGAALRSCPFAPITVERGARGGHGGVDVGGGCNLDTIRDERSIVRIVNSDCLTRRSVNVLMGPVSFRTSLGSENEVGNLTSLLIKSCL